MSFLHYLCLLATSGVQHILWVFLQIGVTELLGLHVNK
jgi:hypothetical protein